MNLDDLNIEDNSTYEDGRKNAEDIVEQSIKEIGMEETIKKIGGMCSFMKPTIIAFNDLRDGGGEKWKGKPKDEEWKDNLSDFARGCFDFYEEFLSTKGR